MEAVAAEHNTDSIQQIALAYVMQKALHVIPLVGGRKVENLQDNIKALGISLGDEQIQRLDDIKPFDIGFPMNLTGEHPQETGQSNTLLASSGQIAWERSAKPIGRA